MRVGCYHQRNPSPQGGFLTSRPMRFYLVVDVNLLLPGPTRPPILWQRGRNGHQNSRSAKIFLRSDVGVGKRTILIFGVQQWSLTACQKVLLLVHCHIQPLPSPIPPGAHQLATIIRSRLWDHIFPCHLTCRIINIHIYKWGTATLRPIIIDPM